MAIKGMVKVIEQFAVHDGPGARLIVFLKGCMLRCKWCQNPETIKLNPELWFNKVRCKDEGRCVEACPNDALTMDKENKIILEKCDQCFECVAACRPNALEIVGKEMTAEELAKEIMKYKFFFSRSREGGVTISGGDPLFQPDFTAEVLRLCHEGEAHTSIETALYAKYETVWKLVSLCDVLICDLKHMDSARHKEGTGVPNELILENFKKLNEDYDKTVAVHIPLIPGYNDDEENIVKTLDFLKPLKMVERIDLLPFNVLPVSKYQALGLSWEYMGVERQSEEYLLKLKELAESYNRFKVTVGGMW